jgi:predicted GNAT superfamily acetyltransferase
MRSRATHISASAALADAASPVRPPALTPAQSPDVAWPQADAAAQAAGVTIREARGPAELTDVCALLADIWQEKPEDRAQTPVMLRALSYGGNYVSVATCAGELVGACVGFFSVAEQWELHSHIAGVTASMRGRNVGFALKAHQRAWALGRGLDTINWTFDPLIRRNAYFNLCKLAARPRTYLVDFYGPMSDGVNTGDHSDRLLLAWSLASEPVARACAGEHDELNLRMLDGPSVVLGPDETGQPRLGVARSRLVLVGIPQDAELLRAQDPTGARRWRLALREVLGGLLDEGADVIGFARDGWYLVDRGAA